jgi:hypothetical protein
MAKGANQKQNRKFSIPLTMGDAATSLYTLKPCATNHTPYAKAVSRQNGSAMPSERRLAETTEQISTIPKVS